MKLYITRHGQAEPRAVTDEQRRLTAEGRDEVTRLWHMLAAEGIRPSRIVSSPYVRARQTMEEILGVYRSLPCALSDLLVPEGDPALVLDWLVREDDIDGLVLVSHMPLVGLLAGLLSAGPGGRVPFVTGGTAALELEVAASGGGRLLWLRTPAEVSPG